MTMTMGYFLIAAIAFGVALGILGVIVAPAKCTEDDFEEWRNS